MTDPVADAVAALTSRLVQQQTEALNAANQNIAELSATLAVEQQRAAVAQAALDKITAFIQFEQQQPPA